MLGSRLDGFKHLFEQQHGVGRWFLVHCKWVFLDIPSCPCLWIQWHDMGSVALLIARHFPASSAELHRRDSPERPPARHGPAKRPRSYTPAGISQHLSPLRLAFQTVQGHLLPAPAFFKGRSSAWGIHYHCIPSPSAGATPGRVFSLILGFTPWGKLLPCNTTKESRRHHELLIIKIHSHLSLFHRKTVKSKGDIW